MSSTSESARRDIANLARCVSGTAYNCGGTIYKASREADGPAGESLVRFLEMACEVGQEALEWIDGIKDDSVDINTNTATKGPEKEREAWEGLRMGMPKRWELLGTAWLKRGDKKVNPSGFFFSGIVLLVVVLYVGPKLMLVCL